MSSDTLHLPPGVSWIDSNAGLAEVLPELRAAEVFGVDTEADSFYAYRVKVCLVQISTASSHFLIDPLTDVDFAPLGELCRDPAQIKVFHAGANDVALLTHQFDFEFAGLFDTMVAAQVLGFKHTGLAHLLKERFDVIAEKAYQTSDWRKRPLSEGQLTYAAMDTQHLLELHRQLETELRDKGRLEEAEEEFQLLRHVGHTQRSFDPDSFRRVRGARDLEPVQLSVLSELFKLRDEVAQKRDRSPHRVFPDRVLLAIACRRPHNSRELRAIDGLARWQVDRHGRALLKAVRAAEEGGPVPPRGPRKERGGEPPLVESERQIFEVLRAWRRDRAAEREVDEARVATTTTLKAIARARPSTIEELAEVPGMLRFRVREFGREILGIIEEQAGPS